MATATVDDRAIGTYIQGDPERLNPGTQHILNLKTMAIDMNRYDVAIKRALNGGFRVCLISADNGKLVLQGEIINKLRDANAVANDVRDAWNAKANTIPVKSIELLQANHRWPGNAGPKAKKKK